MDPPSSPIEKTITTDHFGTVDTSRPFRSVKEAVAIFGERFLAGDLYSQQAYTNIPRKEVTQKPVLQVQVFTPSTLSNPKQARDDQQALTNAFKKLEMELEETKRELNLLKEKESETEIALASLNAQVHKNMSKMALAEADAAAKAVSTRAEVVREIREDDIVEVEDEVKKKDSIVKMESSLSMATILSLVEKEDYKYYEITKKQKKMMKKKPIIPLVGDLLFSRKKGSPTTLHNPLYSSSII